LAVNVSKIFSALMAGSAGIGFFSNSALGSVAAIAALDATWFCGDATGARWQPMQANKVSKNHSVRHIHSTPTETKDGVAQAVNREEAFVRTNGPEYFR
jgi:hypothetical protein